MPDPLPPLRRGLTPGGRRHWLWKNPPTPDVGGYGDPASFALPVGPAVWRAPEQVLPAGSSSSEAERDEYRRRSVDLTMRGGTTSGVVYPLAVCEIARGYRVRNVGGASAGAIAAAATAAAELGRSTSALDRDTPPQGHEPIPAERFTALDPQRREAGHVRAGFAGLADLVAWLAQIAPDRPETGTADAFRLAQLFRPGPEARDRRVFAVLVAVMRERLWAAPMTALLAFGWRSKLALVAVTAAAALLCGWVGTTLAWPHMHRAGNGWPGAAGWGALDLFLAYVLAGLILAAWPRRRKPDDDANLPGWVAELKTVASRFRRPPGPSHTVQQLGAGLGIAALAVAAALGWWHWVAGLLVWFVASVAMAAVVAFAVYRFLATQHRFGYGVLAGAPDPERQRGRRDLSELLAGAPAPTVDRPLVQWLADSYAELAGLPAGAVLRFGHLWQGHDFQPAPEPTGELRAIAATPRARLVNLQLVTTDLTRQRPYVFPLDWAPGGDPGVEQLYLDRADLEGHFPADVLDALCESPAVTVPAADGSGPRRLHRLPDPWNLPVVFAVRLSMSLPVLFKAVRLYRLVGGAAIRDDLGRSVLRRQRRLQYPQDGQIAEALWFSDGGITSNFPVHLFDTLLPAWPTFGLNLGDHPPAFPHQDVWLPQDWQASRAPAAKAPRSLFDFAFTILDTARNWRDTMQTGMPGYRGRVAWVRQRPDEGGNNLFMPREVIASMALRGALAGARLSRRFADSDQWTRYRWLRLRIALANVERLHHTAREHAPAYRDLMATPDSLPGPDDTQYPYDPYSAGIDWYRPVDLTAFWTAGTALLRGITAEPPGDGVLGQGSPRPHPDLTQTPPM
ncbi:patatin-like phospholipase family protein [Dactylosporangium vinaceum]|uniref:Patatin-like phospholipase family protein n=1 Tax=Dactylosporangium vinaceum TaxID=53362 RepID=A0ABV5MSB4_9ACTN|nr:patatin-like phospholipase family protein [Dactylosporangium vinaceum]UAC00480.1 patatin-like phospholipase family protein [Dactylosporangium vinaceum]